MNSTTSTDARNATIRMLTDVDVNDVVSVGGKGANLGELLHLGIHVPRGFVITADAYLDAVGSADTRDLLRAGTERAPSMNDHELADFAAATRRHVGAVVLPVELIAQVHDSMHALGVGRVAVRSSATAEDAADTSFAGMHASFTNVGIADVADRVRDCWRSLFGDRAVAYRAERGLTDEPAIAVVVQEMLPSERAGVMFTSDESRDSLVIEATFGLGEFVVAGTVEPDSYRVARHTLELVDVHIGDKTSALISTPDGETTIDLGDRAHQRVLSDDEIEQVAALGMSIEQHYGSPQDIEFAFVGDQLSIVQARPITFVHADEPHRVLLRGLGVGSTHASGPVRILHSPRDGADFTSGEVLVAEMTSPDWVPILRRAAALVTDAGGSTCHAAIISRELGIPGVVGTRTATADLRDGDIITVDAASGTIIAGEVSTPAPPSGQAAVQTAHEPGGLPTSAPFAAPVGTKIYVNLAVSQRAPEIASRQVDGVGLLRGEFLVMSALGGTHPRQLIDEGGGNMFVDKMSAELATIAGAFAPRPVVYRTMDFPHQRVPQPPRR